MPDYEKMYHKIFNLATDVDRTLEECVNALEAPNIFTVKRVRSVLAQLQISIAIAQKKTEEMYIEGTQQ